MPLANQKQVVGLSGSRASSSYHKTTALLTLIVAADRFEVLPPSVLLLRTEIKDD